MIILGPTNSLAGVAAVSPAITCTIFADIVQGANDVFDVLYQGVLPSAVEVLVPAGTTSLIKTITLTNTTATAVTGVRLFVNNTANANRIANLTIPANGSATFGQDGWRVYDENGLQALTSGGGSAPTSLLPGEVFIVPARRQVLFTIPIDTGLGTLVVDGDLVEVD